MMIVAVYMGNSLVGHNGDPRRGEPLSFRILYNFFRDKADNSGLSLLMSYCQAVSDPQAESRVPGRGVVDSLHNFGIERIAFDKLQLLRQLAVKLIGRIARAVRKARVRPMCEATRSFLPAPYLPDNLLVFRGAGVDDNLPAYHAAFAALRGQPFPFKLHVRKRPHPTAAIKAVGGIVRFPERIVIAEDLAMERPVVWAGAAVEYRDIHPLPFSG